jgi:hypothetical protein
MLNSDTGISAPVNYARATPTLVEVDWNRASTSLSAAKSNTFDSVASVVVVVASDNVVLLVVVVDFFFKEDLPACVPPVIHAWTRGLLGVGT